MFLYTCVSKVYKVHVCQNVSVNTLIYIFHATQRNKRIVDINTFLTRNIQIVGRQQHFSCSHGERSEL